MHVVQQKHLQQPYIGLPVLKGRNHEQMTYGRCHEIGLMKGLSVPKDLSDTSQQMVEKRHVFSIRDQSFNHTIVCGTRR